MIYFTSDLHLGHEACIRLSNRPFCSAEEMNETLINNWNRRVKKNDTVYIVGDLAHRASDPLELVARLNGNKILIAGNHDLKWLKKDGMARSDKSGGVEFCDYSEYFNKIAQYLEISTGEKTVTLCHYPMIEWKASRKLGSEKLGYLIHGHIHNGTAEKYIPLFVAPHALNAGTDVNNYMPVTFEELVANNEKFKLEALTDPVRKAEFLAAKYHLYQTDKSGKPYFFHPKAVAEMLDADVEKCVGYLHDLLEDTEIAPELLKDNFTAEITDAVTVLTRADGEDYFAYIEKVSHNALATRVKLADLTHNMDLSRLKAVTDRDKERIEKYKKAYEILAGTGNRK